MSTGDNNSDARSTNARPGLVDEDVKSGKSAPPPPKRRGMVKGFFRALSGWGVIERATKTARSDTAGSFNTARGSLGHLLARIQRSLEDLRAVKADDASFVDRFDRTPAVITVFDDEAKELQPLLLRIRFAIVLYSIAIAAGAAMLTHGSVAFIRDGQSLFTVMSHLISGLGLFVIGWIKLADSAVDYAVASGSAEGPFNTLRAMVRPLSWIPYSDQELFKLRVWPKVAVSVIVDAAVFVYLYR